MSETVAVSVQRIHAHLSGFQDLVNSSTPKKDAVETLRIPPSFKITAKLINDVASTQNFMNIRIQLPKQTQHEPARLAQGALAATGTLVHHARTVNDVKDAQTNRRAIRVPLR